MENSYTRFFIGVVVFFPIFSLVRSSDGIVLYYGLLERQEFVFNKTARLIERILVMFCWATIFLIAILFGMAMCGGCFLGTVFGDTVGSWFTSQQKRIAKNISLSNALDLEREANNLSAEGDINSSKHILQQSTEHKSLHFQRSFAKPSFALSDREFATNAYLLMVFGFIVALLNSWWPGIY